MKKFLIVPVLFAVHCAAAEQSGDYELKGFFGTGENIEVSVRRTGDDKSVWLHLGQKQNGLLLEKTDAKTGTATLNVNGVRKNLRLAGEAPTKPPKNYGRINTEFASASRLGARMNEIEISAEHNEAVLRLVRKQDAEFLAAHPGFEGPHGIDLDRLNQTDPALVQAYMFDRKKRLDESTEPLIREVQRLNKIRMAAFIEAEKSPTRPQTAPHENETSEAAFARMESEQTKLAAKIADRMLAEDEAKNGPSPKLTLTPIPRKSY